MAQLSDTSGAATEHPPEAPNATCPCCGADRAETIHEVPQVPVHDVQLMRTRADAVNCGKGDIALTLCATCGFLWNSRFDRSLLDYGLGYESTQAFSPTFNRFHTRLAHDLIDRFDLTDKSIIEIGCGQGEFLSMLCDMAGASGTGFDPAYAGRQQAGRVRYVKELYAEAYADQPVDFVCCKMTLEHIEHALGFVGIVRQALRHNPDASTFFQVPDVQRILEERAFWDIYYEHCSYFSAGALARLFRRAGLQVGDVWRDYDDQYLMIEARTGKRGSAPFGIEESPREIGRNARTFAARVGRDIAAWRTWLDRQGAAGRQIALWGGGSKAVAFISHLAGAPQVSYVVDINPRKADTFLPGSGHEIVAPSRLGEMRPDIVIVMNPIYQNEIAAALAAIGLAPTILTVDAASAGTLAELARPSDAVDP